MRVENVISISGNIFFKIRLHGVAAIKLIPTCDAKHGIVLKMIEPERSAVVLDKKWIKINKGPESFSFRCPSFLSACLGTEIEIYEDEFEGGICCICDPKNHFNVLKNSVKPLRLQYEPSFSSDGKIIMSFAYARDHLSVKKDLYASGNIEDISNIQVQIFGGGKLIPNEYASKLIKLEHEFISKPLLNMPENIDCFKYKNCFSNNSILTIRMGKAYEGHGHGNGRCVSGIRQRAIRVRRIRDAAERTTPFNRR